MNNRIANALIDHAAKKHGSKFVGIPTGIRTFDFHFEQVEMLAIEKSNVTTINPIK